MAADAPGRVAGILLAAGQSTRLGRNKLLLQLDGESVLRRSARAAVGAGLDPVVVVVGYEADAARRELEGLACQPVFNPDSARGPHTSLRAGLAALPPDAAGAVVLLADMPLVSSDMIAALVHRYRGSRAPLVLSRYGDAQAPPTLYGRRLLPELAAEEGEAPGKRVVARHGGEAESLEWPADALADLDREEDVARVEAILRLRARASMS